MSRKPPKKSDMGKSWMKPRRDSRQMISPEYHLIVSEGTKTEPKYFEKIKETIDAKYRDRISGVIFICASAIFIYQVFPACPCQRYSFVRSFKYQYAQFFLQFANTG